MERLASIAEAEWIARATVPLPLKAGTGVTVASCIPAQFEAYVKIFHPIFEDLSVEDRQQTWDQEEKRLLSAPVSAMDAECVVRRSILVYSGAEPGSPLRRISWKELAKRYDVEYTPLLNASAFSRRFPGGSWPRYLIGPAEGSLDARTRDELANILDRVFPGTECYFHFWFLAASRWPDDLLYRGAIKEVAAFPEEVEEVRLTPTHWFPQDHRWLVCTDYDLTFTLIGGPESLISSVMRSEILECVRVHPDTRVDNRSDEPAPGSASRNR